MSKTYLTSNGVEFLISETQAEIIDTEKCCYDKSNGYVVTKHNGKWEYLHRVVMNASKDQIVDHINRNKLDNRIENLRFVTKSENNINREAKGIYYDKYGNRWRACLGFNGKILKLGSFQTKEEAISARKEAEKKYFPQIFS